MDPSARVAGLSVVRLAAGGRRGSVISSVAVDDDYLAVRVRALLAYGFLDAPVAVVGSGVTRAARVELG